MHKHQQDGWSSGGRLRQRVFKFLDFEYSFDFELIYFFVFSPQYAFKGRLAVNPTEKVLIYCNHRYDVEYVVDLLSRYAKVAICHAEREATQNGSAVGQFEVGKVQVLAMTDMVFGKSKYFYIVNMKLNFECTKTYDTNFHSHVKMRFKKIVQSLLTWKIIDFQATLKCCTWLTGDKFSLNLIKKLRTKQFYSIKRELVLTRCQCC